MSTITLKMVKCKQHNKTMLRFTKVLRRYKKACNKFIQKITFPGNYKKSKNRLIKKNCIDNKC